MRRRLPLRRTIARPRLGGGLVAALALAGSAAVAAPADRLDLARPASPWDQAQAMKAAGIATTALERRFGDRRATAAVGFLCGLQPSAQTSGGASAYGVDPQGRFLGAQLRFGFR